MRLDEQIHHVVADAVTAALTEVAAGRPAPYPVAVGVTQAATLLSVSPDTIRRLIANGRLRTLDLGTKRRLIPTVALFELDPGFGPTHAERLFAIGGGS